ncbi:hypothetical protein FGO68_gene11997 [Halteria grandinella]|uniref:Tyrosine specific protein phosphatases domain-containing protein n=1 Tax=Halteria grandinella TaxID=5974 RepID=A0A8J8NK01_HALGN|nr:hypothetical protein FGO68_gene11997 [Halteria grandinella]
MQKVSLDQSQSLLPIYEEPVKCSELRKYALSNGKPRNLSREFDVLTDLTIKNHESKQSAGLVEGSLYSSYDTSHLIQLCGVKGVAPIYARKGPYSQDVASFWQDLNEKDCKVVVCLTEVSHRHSSWGIACYWDPVALQNFKENQVQINMIERKALSSNLGQCKIGYTLGQSSGTVKHLHFEDFPDLGVPSSYEELSIMINVIIEELNALKGNGKVLMHCRSGIGRTGKQQLKEGVKDPLISIFSILRQLRDQRMWLCETSQQYKFVYGFVIDWIDKNL